MAWRHKHNATTEQVPPLPPPAVRVLRDPAELAAATERAAEGERRLRERLDARARREAQMAQREVSERGRTIRWPDSLKAPQAAKAMAAPPPKATIASRPPHSPAA